MPTGPGGWGEVTFSQAARGAALMDFVGAFGLAMKYFMRPKFTIYYPFEKGPLGHSDGDVVCHAATDAVLGAAALGDIGRHFPDTDPRWKGADSVELLRQAVALVRSAGYVVVNVDVTVVLERPKIKPHIDAMRERVSGALGVDVTNVSIKGKTNEGVDAVGRGEAIAAHAVAMIARA